MPSSINGYAAEGLPRDGFWLVRPPFPTWMRKASDHLYGNIFCSPLRFQEETENGSIFAVVLQNQENVKQVILFSKEGRKLNVLNELFTLPSVDLEQFVRYVFDNWSEISCIALDSICVNSLSLPYPYQCFNKTEDIAARLPAKVADYQSMLSKNTWAALRRYQKKIRKDYPDITFSTYQKNEAGTRLTDQIIELNKARLANKREEPTHSDASIAELKRMVAAHGITLVAKRGDALCGGVICTRIHDHVYMHVIAHDPTYDHLRLGKICCFLSICDAIERGSSTYHMLSGEYDYKYQFLGERRAYDKLVIYRSYPSLLLNLAEYANNEVRGRGRKIKQVIKVWRKKWKR